MSWWIIHFGMFLSVTQWSDRCVPWQILFVGVFVWALAPFVCLVCCSSLTKRKSGWGICGSSGWSVWFLVCCDLPAFPDLLGLCTNDVFTAYAHVRTEPQCDIGHTRGKKIVRKVKKCPEDIHLALAPNPRVLLGSCAPSSAVSVAGGWWVAAVGFVVVLQRYRSCGSWACPGGLVAGHGGTLRVGSEVSKSCD